MQTVPDPHRLDYETPDSAGPFHGLKSPPTTLQRGFGCLTFFVCAVTAFVFGLLLIVEWPDLPWGMIEFLAACAAILAGIAILQVVRFGRMG